MAMLLVPGEAKGDLPIVKEHNFIDKHILAKLRRLRLPSAELGTTRPFCGGSRWPARRRRPRRFAPFSPIAPPISVRRRLRNCWAGRVMRRCGPRSFATENLENRYDARLEGKLVYDQSKKRFTRWDMVALGDYTGANCACQWGDGQEGNYVTKEPMPIAMSFEIDNNNYELPAEYRRSTPYLIWWFRNRGPDYYFNRRNGRRIGSNAGKSKGQYVDEPRPLGSDCLTAAALFASAVRCKGPMSEKRY